MAFTRMPGAHSAASDRVNPSTAPFAAAMLAWKLSPVPTATVLNKTTEADGDRLSSGSFACNVETAPSKFTSRSCSHCSRRMPRNGLSAMVPGQYTSPSSDSANAARSQGAATASKTRLR